MVKKKRDSIESAIKQVYKNLDIIRVSSVFYETYRNYYDFMSHFSVSLVSIFL